MTPTNHNFLVAFCLMRDEAAVSYSWVLQGLRDIFGTAQTPSVIVTDRDEGLSAAIRDVFPDVRHLLCTWHIGNDVENMVDKLCGGKKNQQGQLFRKSRWNPLVESATIQEYEKRWEGIGYGHGHVLQHLSATTYTIYKWERKTFDVSVRRVKSIIVDVKRSRGRPKRIWDEQIRVDLQELNLSADLTRDRSS
ncbi:protein FAR1-RELATED SEQUENCE 2-like [Amaranthus tricolor]|uniref:protein FAR1-RELATED SEQUENCE 2-like n=1 Tax=Amaranthus tricolor TaxID=29722 RepID=UPI0025896C64|nr:protein FAR1-RELATED SEQUENCE 2-like [Amaranthus tricolor]